MVTALSEAWHTHTKTHSVARIYSHVTKALHFLQRKHFFPLISHFTHSTEHYRSFWFPHLVFKGIDMLFFLLSCSYFSSLTHFPYIFPLCSFCPNLSAISTCLHLSHNVAVSLIRFLRTPVGSATFFKKKKGKYVPWLLLVPRAWRSWLSVTELRTSSVQSRRSPNHTPPGWLSEPYSVSTVSPSQPSLCSMNRNTHQNLPILILLVLLAPQQEQGYSSPPWLQVRWHWWSPSLWRPARFCVTSASTWWRCFGPSSCCTKGPRHWVKH